MMAKMNRKNKLKKAIYPGSFDPITFGHLDIINRAICVADHLLIAVAIDNMKSSIFSYEERMDMIRHEIAKIKNTDCIIEVASFDGLLVNFARNNEASLIIRGLRAISDFEYEFQMSCLNSKLAAEIQTIFLPASEKTHFVSSRLVKEVYRLGGDVSDCVSDYVSHKLSLYYNR
jgi:pantetheine-phosphate adenylyltransferase